MNILYAKLCTDSRTHCKGQASVSLPFQMKSLLSHLTNNLLTFRSVFATKYTKKKKKTIKERFFLRTRRIVKCSWQKVYYELLKLDHKYVFLLHPSYDDFYWKAQPKYFFSSLRTKTFTINFLEKLMLKEHLLKTLF